MNIFNVIATKCHNCCLLLFCQDALTSEISEACLRLCYDRGQSYYRFDPLLTMEEYVHTPEEVNLQTLVNILLRTISQCHNDEKLKNFGRKFS